MKCSKNQYRVNNSINSGKYFFRRYLEAIFLGTIILKKKSQPSQKQFRSSGSRSLDFSKSVQQGTNDILNSLSGKEVIFNADPPNIMFFISAPKGKHLKGREKHNTKINVVTSV